MVGGEKMTNMFISKTKKEIHLKIKSSLGEKVFRICNVLLLLLMMVSEYETRSMKNYDKSSNI